MKPKKHLIRFLLVFCVVFFVLDSFGEKQGLFNEDLLKNFTYRNLGPFRSGSWIVDFAVPEFPQEAHLYTFYVASRNGGLWKTINNGTTFKPIFDNQNVISIGDIALAPSNPDIVWVGTGEAANARSSYWGNGVYKSTDDGKVWLTKNSGAAWTELTHKIADEGGPENYWVSRVFASSFKEGTAYVSKSGYRRDDFRLFLYKTTDFGETWTSIASNLPDKPINVIFEDRKNPNLLFLGTDMGVYVAINGGKRWVRIRNNMPTVAVHDLLVHPRENDLVVGTYGRGIFITDITPLQEIIVQTFSIIFFS